MKNLSQKFLSNLQKIFSENGLMTDPAECWAYGYDNSRQLVKPDAVVFPENAEQIQKLIQLCNEYQIPITPRGRATGTPGGAVPVNGGVVLSCERMQKIIEIDPDNRWMMVEPGVLNQTIQDEARKHGLFWAPDPSSAPYCTVGGNIAYNSAGPRAIKYGTTRENILGLKAITGDGKKIATGGYTTKQSVGYDLSRLLIGSEGTLAVITEATLKLLPLPETHRTIRVMYRDANVATEIVSRLMRGTITPCAIEFMDEDAVTLIRDQGITLPNEKGVLLLLEIDGLNSEMDHAIKVIEKVLQHKELIEIKIAADETESKLLWHARKALSPALRTIASEKINEDVVVPLTKIPALLEVLKKLKEKFKLTIVNFGHIGNGNLHVNILTNNTPEEIERAQNCLKEVFKSVLQLQGNLSGEHGIGFAKKAFMSQAIDPDTLELMKSLKNVFDPKHILNPGKLW